MHVLLSNTALLPVLFAPAPLICPIVVLLVFPSSPCLPLFVTPPKKKQKLKKQLFPAHPDEEAVEAFPAHKDSIAGNNAIDADADAEASSLAVSVAVPRKSLHFLQDDDDDSEEDEEAELNLDRAFSGEQEVEQLNMDDLVQLQERVQRDSSSLPSGSGVCIARKPPSMLHHRACVLL